MEGEGCVTGLRPETGNPLLRAVFLRRLRLTRLLLEGGAYINESDSSGQTPLMVACRTQHNDAQSASRVRLVQYLQESGADPNIQDKAGRSALMHACLDRAGGEVVTLLLDGGADPGLEDRSGNSALLHAVTAGDQEVLKLLLDACKARGKEVIIITTDTFPCGKTRARQYLNKPPLVPLDQGDRLHPSAGLPCASPSEIQLLTSPQCSSYSSSSSSSSSCPSQQVFSFKQCGCSGCGAGSSQPCSPSRAPGLGQGRSERLLQPFQRLNSEPWLRIPASLLALQPSATPSSTDDLPDITPEEELSLRASRLRWNTVNNDHGAPLRRNCSIDLRNNNTANTASFSKSEGRGADMEEGEVRGLLGSEISLNGLSSSHSTSHPDLHSHYTSSSTGGREPGGPLPSLAVSSLRSIIQRRHLGADHYNSDPQLAAQARGFPEEGRAPLESRRLVTSRSSTLLGSRESMEPPSMTRRALSGLERRGSGNLLLDQVSQTRPGCLPPLNPPHHHHHHHTPIPIPHIAAGASPSSSPSVLGSSPSTRAVGGAVAGLKLLHPSAPSGLPRDLRTRRLLQRRHSIQTE